MQTPAALQGTLADTAARITQGGHQHINDTCEPTVLKRKLYNRQYEIGHDEVKEVSEQASSS